MAKPIFSVIMPVFNQVSYITEAIDSVINQDCESWELIVIDNHSDDGTLEIIQKYSDPRIRVIQVKNHGIIAHSRNAGVREAKGDFIAFLDSDDTWSTNKLSVAHRVLSEGKSFIYHYAHVVSSEGDIVGEIRSRKLTSHQFEDLLVNGNPIVNSTVVMDRQSLLDIGLIDESPDIVAVEDYNTWLRLSHAGIQFHLIPQYLGNYRIHAESISSARNKSGVPSRAFRGIESLITEPLRDRIESKYWEIQGKTSFRKGDFNYAHSALGLAAINAVGTHKTKLRFYRMLAMLLMRRTKSS